MFVIVEIRCEWRIRSFVWGVASAKKRKAFVLSTLMRKTIKKLGGYFSVILVFICVEKAINIPAGLCVSVGGSDVGMWEVLRGREVLRSSLGLSVGTIGVVGNTTTVTLAVTGGV